MRDVDFYPRAERRIAWLTLLLGLTASGTVALAISGRAGAGVAIGTLLAWVNCRWLQRALDALVEVSVSRHDTLPHQKASRIPVAMVLRYVGRYVLIGLALSASVLFLAVPVLSVLAGLLALGAAAIVEGIYEAVVHSD